MLKKGFTLIELMVVVLIIAVLAAIALPKYNAAVDKAHMARVMALTQALKSAGERFFLAKGSYAITMKELDVEPQAACTYLQNDDLVYCDDSWYDINSGLKPSSSASWYVMGYTGPRYNKDGSTNNKILNMYKMWFHGSASPDMVECVANDNSQRARDVCVSLGGTLLTGNRYKLK